MANTISNTRLIQGSRHVIQYITISSDGTQETDLVVYDSSAVASNLNISDPLDCTINSIFAVVEAASTARVWLEFDASTDVLAMAIPVMNTLKADFKKIGGLENNAGSGVTGDITLTTTGLASGDKITLVLDVRAD